MNSIPFTAGMKLVLLTVSSICTHVSLVRSPTSSPRREERVKYAEKRESFLGEDGFSAAHAACVMTYIFHIVNAFHALAILASFELPLSAAFRNLLREGAGSPIPSFELLFGSGFIAIGTTIRILSYRALGHFFTFYLAIRKDHRLVTTWPYSIVRHPSYTGTHLVIIGIYLVHLGSGSGFAELGLWYTALGCISGICQGALVFYLVWTMHTRIPREDAVLRETFGDEWQAWARRTPYKLLPGVY